MTRRPKEEWWCLRRVRLWDFRTNEIHESRFPLLKGVSSSKGSSVKGRWSQGGRLSIMEYSNHRWNTYRSSISIATIPNHLNWFLFHHCNQFKKSTQPCLSWNTKNSRPSILLETSLLLGLEFTNFIKHYTW